MRRDILLQLLLVAAVLFGGRALPAQESAIPSKAAAASIFDHQHAAWTKLLADFVHDKGLVDYRGLAKRRVEFNQYLRSLETVTAKEFASWQPLQREAFWINAYNAYAIRLILDNYPVDSIKDLGGFFSSVFSKEFIPLQHLATVDPRSEAGSKDKLTLGEVEHDILANISKKPLFHFAIVCASWSCPELLNRAYAADSLVTQLEAQTRLFLADASKNHQQIVGGKLRVSKIFDWAEDELNTYPGEIRGLIKDFGPASVTKDPALGKVKFKYRDYDWSLNEWKAPPSKTR
jgi:hypothetical protein